MRPSVLMLGSFAMGSEISAMHYTGMAAASFREFPLTGGLAHTINVTALGTAGIVIITFLVLAFALIAAILDRRFSTQQEALVPVAVRHRTLEERSLAGVCWSTKQGRITNCNEACARILGYRSREVRLHSETDQLYCSAEIRSRLLESLKLFGQLTNFECWLTRLDGSLACVLTNANLLQAKARKLSPVQ